MDQGVVLGVSGLHEVISLPDKSLELIVPVRECQRLLHRRGLLYCVVINKEQGLLADDAPIRGPQKCPLDRLHTPLSLKRINNSGLLLLSLGAHLGSKCSELTLESVDLPALLILDLLVPDI